MEGGECSKANVQKQQRLLQKTSSLRCVSNIRAQLHPPPPRRGLGAGGWEEGGRPEQAWTGAPSLETRYDRFPPGVDRSQQPPAADLVVDLLADAPEKMARTMLTLPFTKALCPSRCLAR